MLKKVAFTMYPVTDVARARKFYEETLGLKSGSVGNRGDRYWVEYDLPGGGCLALTNFVPDAPSAAAGGTSPSRSRIPSTASSTTSRRRASRSRATSSTARSAGWRCA